MTRPSEASVVPIRLTLDGRSGVTLWATPWVEDGEQWQAFLGSGERVLVFGDLGELADFLASGAENDLSDHPSWPTLRTLPASQLRPEQGYDFDLDGAYDLALDEPDPFTVSRLSDLLDIVQRIAECCDDGTLLRLLEDSPEFSGLLADEATYTGVSGEERWTRLGEALDRSWELVVGRLDGLLEWRNPVLVETDEEAVPAGEEDQDALDEAGAGEAELAGGVAPGGVAHGRTAAGAAAEADDAAGDTAAEAEDAAGDTAAEANDTAGGPEEFEDVADSLWEEAGIVPIELTVPGGTGYTLRTYVAEKPRFLGSDLTVDVFHTMDELIGFARAEDAHDLADLDTWALIRDAEPEMLAVLPAEDESYDLTAPDPDALDLARDLAGYCQLAGVDAVLAERAVQSGVPFDLWVAAVKEIATCLRWHD